MNTNWRKTLQKGYGKLAFAMLIVAMCFTAFVASPFCNTQAQAAAGINSSHDTLYDSSGETIILDTGVNLSFKQGQGVFFGTKENDPDGAGKILNKSPNSSIDERFDYNRSDSKPKPVHFMNKYYDFTSAGTDELKPTGFVNEKFVFNKNTNNFTLTKTLDNLDTHFGVGHSTYGYQMPTRGANFSTIEGATELEATVEGWSNDNKSYFDENSKDEIKKDIDIMRRWSMETPYMYTFIKVPSYIAKNLSVSVTANMDSNPKATLASRYGNTYMLTPVMEVVTGQKTVNDNKSLKMSQSDTSYVAGVTKNAENKLTNNAGSYSAYTTASIPFTDSSSDESWIKISFAVFTADPDGSGDDYGEKYVWKPGLTDQKWDNKLKIKDVKLNFTLTPPSVLNVTSDDNEFTNKDRILNSEIAFDKKYLVAKNGEIDNAYCQIGDGKMFSIILHNIADGDNLTNDKPITFTENSFGELEFNVSENGTYILKVFYNDAQPVLLSESKPFIVKNIDRVKPNKPTFNDGMKFGMRYDADGNIWLLQNDANNGFGITNILDDTTSGTDKNNAKSGTEAVYITYYKDATDLLNPGKESNKTTKITALPDGYLTDGMPNEKWFRLDTTKESELFDITDLISTFFTDKQYGTYNFVFASVDKAGNISDFVCQKVNYENDEPYDLSNMELKIGDTTGVYNNFNAWLTGTKGTNDLTISFTIPTDKYHFKGTDKAFSFKLMQNGAYVNDGTTDYVFDETTDGINNKYTLTIPVDKLTKLISPHQIELTIADGCVFNYGNEAVDFPIKVMVDKTAPNFDATSLQLYHINTTVLKSFKDNLWYSFENNILFKDFNKLSMNPDIHKGLFFEIDASKEDAQLFLSDYKIKLKDENGKIIEQPFEQPLLQVSPNNPNNIIVFVPFNNGKNTNVTLTITDQTGFNKKDITIPSINFDGREFTLSKFDFRHFELENDFISFWQVLGNEIIDENGNVVNFADLKSSQITEQNGFRRLGANDINNITNKSFRRGTQIIIKIDNNFNQDGKFEYVNADTNIIYNLNRLENAKPEQSKQDSNLFRLVAGNYINDGNVCQNIGVELAVYKNIEIDLFDSTKGEEPLLTVDNPVKSPKLVYTGTERSFIVKTHPENRNEVAEVIANGFTINVLDANGKILDKVNDAETITKLLTNANEGGAPIRVTCDVKNNNPNKWYKTVETKTFYIYINKKDVTATVSGLDFVTDNTGNYLKIQYGDDKAINIAYNGLVSGENIDIQLGVKDVINTGYIPMYQLKPQDAKYKLDFYNANNNGLEKNYNFNFKNESGNKIDLLLKVDKRNVKIIVADQGFVYGGNHGDFVVDNNKVKFDDSTLSDKLKEHFAKEPAIFVGNITTNAKANSPVSGTYNYKIQSTFAVKGLENCFNFKLNPLSETFKISKRPVEFNSNCLKEFTYGYNHNFLNPDKLNFKTVIDGVDYGNVSAEDIDTIISAINVAITLKEGSVAVLDTVKLLNAGTYVVKYSTTKTLDNFDITIPVEFTSFEVKVNPKNVDVTLNYASSILQSSFDKLTVDGKLVKVDNIDAFKLNIDAILEQLVGLSVEDKDIYKTVLNNLAVPFTITKPASVTKTTEVVIDIVDGFSALVYADATLNGKPQNFNFVPSAENVKFKIIVLADGNYRIEFKNKYYSFTYGTDTIKDNSLLLNIKKALQLVDNKGKTFIENYTAELGLDGATNKFNDVLDNLIFNIKGTDGTTSPYNAISTQNVGLYILSANLNTDFVHPDWDIDIDASNTIIEIVPKEITIKKAVDAKLNYQFGDFSGVNSKNKPNLDAIFVAYDNNGNKIDGKFIGELVLDGAYIPNSSFYSVGSYNIVYTGGVYNGNNITFKASTDTEKDAEINAKNYIITFPTDVVINITKKTLTVSTSNNVKEYDGTNKINPTFKLNGMIDGFECNIINVVYNTISKDADVYKNIKINSADLIDDKGNLSKYYVLEDNPTFTYTINPIKVNANIVIENLNKVFDNTNNIIYSISNVKDTDVLNLLNKICTITYSDKYVAIDKPIVIEIALDKLVQYGEKASNFDFTAGLKVNDVLVDKNNIDTSNTNIIKVNGVKGEITKATLKFELSADHMVNKVYDGTDEYKLTTKGISSDTTPAIKNIIFANKYFAKYDSANAGKQNLTFTVEFTNNGEFIKDILANINVSIGTTAIEQSDINYNNGVYTITLSVNAEIQKRDVSVVEHKDSLGNVLPNITKVYDGSTLVDALLFNNVKLNILKADINNDFNVKLNTTGVTTASADANKGEDVYTVKVPVIVTGVNNNYNINSGDTIDVTVKIDRKLINVSIKQEFIPQINISKVYDGTNFLNISLNLPTNSYIAEGVLPGEEVLPQLDGEVVFEDPYASDSPKRIQLQGAGVRAINKDGSINTNYAINSKIEGLYGTIKKRPVHIDVNNVYINNTRYFGSDGNNYIVSNTNIKLTNKVYNNTVTVYMPIANATKDVGILPEDSDKRKIDYELYVNIDMELDDKIDGWLQPIKKKSGGKAVLVANNNPNGLGELVAGSYYIDNLAEVFQGGTGNLIVGQNDTGKIEDYAQVHIQPFLITNDNIDTGIIEKVYDGTPKLTNSDANPILAKVGIRDKVTGNFVKSFLTDEIVGIPISGTFDKVNAYEYEQAVPLKNITLSSEILVGTAVNKRGWYDFAPDFNFNIGMIETNPIYGRIVPRSVKYIFTPLDKVYDNTTNAEYGKNFTFKLDDKSFTTDLDGIIKDERNLVGELQITDHYYKSKDVGPSSLYIGGLTFSKQAGRNYRPEIVYTNEFGGKEYAQSHIFNGVNITPRELVVKIGTLELNFMDKLPLVTDIKTNSKYSGITYVGKVDGVNAKDNFVGFENAIAYKYANSKYTNETILNVGTYADLMMVLSDEAKACLPNYKIVVEKGLINVYKRTVKVSFADNFKITTDYGNLVDINNILNNMIFKSYYQNAEGYTVSEVISQAEAEKLKKFIIITGLPVKTTNVGTYQIGIETYNFTGVKNYNPIVFDKVYSVTVNQVEVPITYLDKNYDVVDGVKIPYIERPYRNYDYKNDILKMFSCTSFNTSIPLVLEGNKSNKNEYIEVSFNIADLTEIGANKITLTFSPKKQLADGTIEIDVDKYNFKKTTLDIYVRIIGSPINFVMADNNLTFNNKTQNYNKNLTGLAVADQEKIDFVYLVKNSNGTFKVVTNPRLVGKYYVVAYTNAENKASIHSLKHLSVDEIKGVTGLDANIKQAMEDYGTAYAIMDIQKIRVKNVGETYFNTAPKADRNEVFNTIKSAIKFNTSAITAESNVDFVTDKNGFNEAGVVNISIKLVGVDANNIDCDNYIVDNASIVVNVVTNSISSKDNSITITTKDESNISPDLINVGIYTRPYNEEKNEIETVTGKINLIGNVDYMMLAQFKMGNNNSATAEQIESSKSLKLGTDVRVKVKVDKSAKDKELFIVNENGLCKKIDNVMYLTEGDNVYAEFETNELGWLVFGSGIADVISPKTIAMITISSLVLVGIVAYFIYLIIKIKKSQKA